MFQTSADFVQELYRTGASTRTGFDGSASKATTYYTELVEFVSRVSPWKRDARPTDLLDIGCGSGWSSFCLSGVGYQTTGVDLNPLAFEPPVREGLTLREGSALSLPFESNSFDVVVSYQCVEHLPQPETAFNEMIRVCRPSGVICVVGPNLMSPLLPVKFLLQELKAGKLIFKRSTETPKHPYGNTAFEHLASIPATAWRLLRKLLSRRVNFSMRIPDTVPPFHGDNDACYLCNPTDLKRFFKERGCKVLQNGKHGRPPLSYLVAGGTWVAVEKCKR
jgi:SAM-dependent methyltransferase